MPKFTVELRAAGGWRVINETGHIAETGISTRETALALAKLFEEDPSLCAGMLRWHERKTEAGPDTIQRPIRTGGKAAARRKAPSARRHNRKRR